VSWLSQVYCRSALSFNEGDGNELARQGKTLAQH
jgi:hypothetical protein